MPILFGTGGSVHLLYKDKPLDYRLIPLAELKVRASGKKVTSAKAKPKTNKPVEPRPSRSPWHQNCTVMFADTKKKK